MWLFSRDPTKDFHYEIGDEISGLEERSIWKIRKGKHKVNGDKVSIFAFEAKPGNENEFEIAKGSLKRLKTLRHPNIVTYIDSLESDKILYLVTEYIEPLEFHLESSSYSSKQKSLSITWGLHQVAKGLSFLVNDCNLSHNNICQSSIFVNKAGEWKIGGVDYMTNSDYYPVKLQPYLQRYNPPEANNRSERIKNRWAFDAWGFGCLIWEVYNGSLNKASSLKSVGKIPKTLQSFYCEFVSADQTLRPNFSDFITKAKSERNAYFNNSFIKSMLFLEEIQIKESSEKQHYFSKLASTIDDYPQEICKYKILPHLIQAFEYGNAGSSILGPLFKLSTLLDSEEYQKNIVPCVVKLFSLKDRATRVKLLQQMESLVVHLKENTVNDAIFPQVIQGFIDTSPTIREETVKCMVFLASKLNYNNINVELMKHFARLQAKDEQGGIRTNTTVCLGKIASYLHPQTRQKVLAPALTRAMKDPFPPARIAGVLAMSACQCYFTLNDSAIKVLPSLCCLTVDPEKSVRDQAFKTINGYLSKLEKVSDDPSLKEEMEAAVNAGANSGLTDSAASWAGWAVTSLTSKFYKSSLKTAPKKSNPSENKEVSSNETGNEKKSFENTENDIKDKGESDSDYEKEDCMDDWSTENVDVSMKLNTKSQSDGWDDSGWDDLGAASLSNSSMGSFNNCDKPDPTNESNTNLTSSYSWSKANNPDSDEFFSSLSTTNKANSKRILTQSKTSDSTWSDWDNNSPVSSSNDLSKEEAKQLREQRKLQRQKELKEKRAIRQGAMKLSDKQS